MKKLSLIVFPVLLVILLAPQVFAHHSDTTPISKEQLLKMLDSPDLIILDVRMIGHYETSSIKIKGAQRTTIPDVKKWAVMVSAKKTIVVYGDAVHEANSTDVAFKLQNLGFKHVYYLKGGWEGWLKAGYPVEKR